MHLAIFQSVGHLLANITFADKKWLLLALLIVPVCLTAGSRSKTLGHSQVDVHANLRTLPFIGRLPMITLSLFLLFMCLTLARPELIKHTNSQIILSRDFVIAVDVSGSMNTPLQQDDQKSFVTQSNNTGTNAGQPATATPTPSSASATAIPSGPATTATPATPPTRAQAAREGVRQFLLHRQGDRVALITFDDRCYMDNPLGSNLDQVNDKLDEILYQGGGTNFDGPSDSAEANGAIQCSINHFKDLSKSTTRVFIMVTDGEDSIDAKRATQLTKLMKDEHIRMYVLGVGESWLGQETPDLQKFVEGVGGQVIRIGNAKQMQDGFKLIDSLEKSEVVVSSKDTHFPLYVWFAAVDALFFLLMLSSAVFVREDV